MIKQMVKMSLISILGLITLDVSAAPTVKKLGSGTAYSGTDSAVSAKSVSSVDAGNLNVARAGRSTTVKPASVGKVSATPNVSRLSLGKYLHNAGVSTGTIKKVSEMGDTGTSTSGTSVAIDNITSDVTSLGNRVSAVESSVETAVADVTSNLNDMQDQIDEHIADGDVHISAEDRANWDAKQDALEAGTGISIENGVISANIPEPANVDFSVTDSDANTGKLVSGIAIEDETVTVTRSNVKIPVGGENANPTASIWIQ